MLRGHNFFNTFQLVLIDLDTSVNVEIQPTGSKSLLTRELSAAADQHRCN